MNKQYKRQNEEIFSEGQLLSYNEYNYMYETTLIELQAVSIDAIKSIVHFDNDTEMTSILEEATNNIMSVNKKLGALSPSTCDIDEINDIISHHVNRIGNIKIARIVRYYYDSRIINQYDKYGYMPVYIFLARCSCLLDEAI